MEIGIQLFKNGKWKSSRFTVCNTALIKPNVFSWHKILCDTSLNLNPNIWQVCVNHSNAHPFVLILPHLFIEIRYLSIIESVKECVRRLELISRNTLTISKWLLFAGKRVGLEIEHESPQNDLLSSSRAFGSRFYPFKCYRLTKWCCGKMNRNCKKIRLQKDFGTDANTNLLKQWIVSTWNMILYSFIDSTKANYSEETQIISFKF